MEVAWDGPAVLALFSLGGMTENLPIYLPMRLALIENAISVFRLTAQQEEGVSPRLYLVNWNNQSRNVFNGVSVIVIGPMWLQAKRKIQIVFPDVDVPRIVKI